MFTNDNGLCLSINTVKKNKKIIQNKISTLKVCVNEAMFLGLVTIISGAMV